VSQFLTVPEVIYDSAEDIISLNISNHNIKRISSEVHNMVQVKVLNLSGNKLSTLPGDIGHLNTLEELNVSGNTLSSLPAEIGHMTSLDALDASGVSPLPATCCSTIELLSCAFWDMGCVMICSSFAV
jgi:Leucine-rich repeat (LRR) protein